MNNAQDDQVRRRWLSVTLPAWGLISALFLARIYMLWGARIQFVMATFAASMMGGIITLLTVALPYRVVQNLMHPERRTARLVETVACILSDVLLAYALYSVAASYPPDW